MKENGSLVERIRGTSKHVWRFGQLGSLEHKHWTGPITTGTLSVVASSACRCNLLLTKVGPKERPIPRCRVPLFWAKLQTN